MPFGTWAGLLLSYVFLLDLFSCLLSMAHCLPNVSYKYCSYAALHVHSKSNFSFFYLATAACRRHSAALQPKMPNANFSWHCARPARCTWAANYTHVPCCMQQQVQGTRPRVPGRTMHSVHDLIITAWCACTADGDCICICIYNCQLMKLHATSIFSGQHQRH